MGQASGDELKVVLKEPILIRAKSRGTCENRVIYLSHLDRLAPLFMYSLYFYRKHDSESTDDVFDRLKEAMEANLDVYYPAAGRIRCNELGEPELRCSNEGVLLVEAFTESGIDEFGDMRDTTVGFDRFVYMVDPGPDAPLLVAQVTRCGCGGFVIGFGSRHELLDGLSALHFLSDWASLSRGVPVEHIEPVCHDRYLLRPRHSNLQPQHLRQLYMERFQGIPVFRRNSSTIQPTVTNGDTHPTLNSSTKSNLVSNESQLAADSKSDASVEGKGKEDNAMPGNTLNAQHYKSKQIVKAFSVSDEMIESLKRKAMEGGHLSSCTTFDVVTAHSWLARIKALNLEQTERALLEIAVNSRPRVQPRLPHRYIGNAFIIAYSNRGVGELLGAPFHHVVKCVRDAKFSVDDAYVWESINMVRGLGEDGKALPSFRETTIVSDWTKFSFHQLDFGWGAAAFATPTALILPDVLFLLRDGLDKGGICLKLGLLPHVMDAFEKYFYDF